MLFWSTTGGEQGKKQDQQRRSWTVMQYQKRPQQTLQGILKVGWSFGVMLSWGKEIEPLAILVNKSLDSSKPRKEVWPWVRRLHSAYAIQAGANSWALSAGSTPSSWWRGLVEEALHSWREISAQHLTMPTTVQPLCCLDLLLCLSSGSSSFRIPVSLSSWGNLIGGR